MGQLDFNIIFQPSKEATSDIVIIKVLHSLELTRWKISKTGYEIIVVTVQLKRYVFTHCQFLLLIQINE